MCVYKLIKRVALMCVIVVVSSVTSVITVNIINQALYPNTPYPQKINVSPRYNYESSVVSNSIPPISFGCIESIPPVRCVVEKIKTEDIHVSDDRVYELR